MTKNQLFLIIILQIIPNFQIQILTIFFKLKHVFHFQFHFIIFNPKFPVLLH